MKLKKGAVLLTVVFLIITSLSGCITFEKEEALNVYHAGSLSGPFRELGVTFEEKHSEVEVRREPAGSVETVRKITDQGQEPDVVGVADYSLIPDLMYPDYASWTVKFASNRMVLAHTEESLHVDNINEENWFEILEKEDVKFGFSDPNLDPCGYRSQMVVYLAEKHYGVEGLFEGLIEENTNINVEDGDIKVPNNIDMDREKIMIRPTEMDLIHQLEVGEIDYLFLYQSVVEQQEELEMLSFPEEIDLGSPVHSDFYQEVTLTKGSGESVDGKPIVYGVTIPESVRNKERALDFIESLLTDGKDIMTDMGQDPITPPETDNLEEIPEEIKHLVEKT